MASPNQTHCSSERSSLFSLTIITLILLPLLYLLSTKHFRKATSSAPPIPSGPYQWPLIGNIFQLGTNPHLTLTHFAQSYGPLFSLKLGTQLVVVASSKDAAIEVLRTHDRSMSGRYVPDMAPKLNDFSIGWELECNEKWRKMRCLCKAELFSSKALEMKTRVREGKVTEMVEFIRRNEGKEVKVREVVTATVFNMLSCVLVSKDLISLEAESLDGGMSCVLNRIAELATTPNVSDLYPVLSWFDLQGLRKKVMELHNVCFRMFGAIIEERRRECRDCSRSSDFLDILLRNGSSDDQINGLLLVLILSFLFLSPFSTGTDTSSSTIEWMMAELIKNPKCMKRAMNHKQDDDAIKESSITKLPYLQACFKETLRLHPPGPFLLPHRAISSCEVMNRSIPKNSQVLVNFWAIGRDPENWREPLIFSPERFLSSNVDYKGNDFEFIPFGSGRRICPGLSMATRHASLIVASLIHCFDWSLPDGESPVELDMSDKYGLTLRKKQPLILIPRVKH
ncbi:(S)-N-methylcoclaurine 3'-hydroxylase isozyme 1 (Fragment) [Linum perenne]